MLDAAPILWTCNKYDISKESLFSIFCVSITTKTLSCAMWEGYTTEDGAVGGELICMHCEHTVSVGVL